MRLIHPPNPDLVLELTPQEWEELASRLHADLLLPLSSGGHLARVGGAWILFLIRDPGGRVD